MLSTKTVAKDLTICEEWNLSIDLKLPNRSTSEWRKVFTFQVNKVLTAKSSMPSVWIRPDQSSFMLMITYGFEETYTYNVTKKVNAGNWVNLKISQMNAVREIKVDYKLVYSITNYTPTTWTNVNLTTGDTYANENFSTMVYYRSFEIDTCKTKSEKLRLNKI